MGTGKTEKICKQDQHNIQSKSIKSSNEFTKHRKVIIMILYFSFSISIFINDKKVIIKEINKDNLISVVMFCQI
jgi:hypothetical protein